MKKIVRLFLLLLLALSLTACRNSNTVTSAPNQQVPGTSSAEEQPVQPQTTQENANQSQFANASVGSYVTFGSFEQDNDISNGTEPIEWLVLVKESDRILLISKYALACQPYNTSRTVTTWENCSLRTWLNDTFLNAAFSETEQAMIPSVTVSADKNSSYSTNPGNSTTDKVFLLSTHEAYSYFSDESDRTCQVTAYCDAQGAYRSNNRNFQWWLRTPGFDSDIAAYVTGYGMVNDIGMLVDSIDGTVRPALWVNLDS